MAAADQVVTRQAASILFEGIFTATFTFQKAAANTSALPGKPIVVFREIEAVARSAEEEAKNPFVGAEITMDICAELLTVLVGDTYSIRITDGLLLPTFSGTASNCQFPPGCQSALDTEEYISRNTIITKLGSKATGSAGGLLFHISVPAGQERRIHHLTPDAQVFMMLSFVHSPVPSV